MANRVECKKPCNGINGMPESCNAMQFGEAELEIIVGTSDRVIIPREFPGSIKAYPNGIEDITK